MIRFESVSKRFRRVEVLAGIDLGIERGDRVALVGSNGSGKTTLIRCLLGEYTHSGRLTVDGIEPRTDRETVLRRVGFVPQLPPPLKLPVAQLVAYAAGVCGSDPARMASIGEHLGLDIAGLGRRPFARLSGGQKQKLLISIALGRDCDVLVLDEPAANLDPPARHRFFELLSERVDDAATIISSHRLDEVAPLVNRVVELDHGKVILDDRVADQAEVGRVLACELGVSRADAAFTRAITGWGFSADPSGRRFTGTVAGPDRLRFLGMLSRYAALIVEIRLDEIHAEVPDALACAG